MEEKNHNQNNETQEKLNGLAAGRMLNKATGGNWNKVRNAPIVGNLAKKGENALGNKLANNKLGRNLLNKNGFAQPSSKTPDGSNPQSPSKSGDVGQKKLNNSLKNKAKNLWNQRKNKKNKKNDGKNNEQKGTSQNETESNNGEASSLLDDQIAKIKLRIKIKVALFGIGFLLLFVLGLIIVMVSIGAIIKSTFPFLGLKIYEKEGTQAVYESGTSESKEEIDYYKKLKEIDKKNSEDGTNINVNYIHSILVYVYYQDDSDSDSRKEFDYNEMYGLIDKIVELMKPSDESKTTDYEINGEFYNNLKNSADINSYYKTILKEKDIDSILKEVFDLGEILEVVDSEDNTVITEETKVTVPKTISTPEPKPTPEPQQETKTTTSMSMSDYLLDSIYANVSASDLKNEEAIKAYTIVYSTNIVANNSKLTIDSSTASALENKICSPEKGCSYYKSDNNYLLQEGPGEKSELNNIVYGGKYYYKQPLSNSDLMKLKQAVNSVYGNVLVSSSGTYSKLSTDSLNLSGNTYQEILKNTYTGYTIKNIGEGSYDSGVNYGLLKVQTTAIFYDQNDYADYNFCGKKRETIKTSGCGVTAMAIIVSTYEKDKKYDPPAMMKDARSYGSCGGGIVGTSPSFFKKEAKKMNYKYLSTGKKKTTDLNLVLKHLSLNHLVIAHMGPGKFTNGGHYIVLGGVDPETKRVYVYDPYDKVNKTRSKKSGNGWYSFNDIIVKEAYNFYIIWKE